MRPFSFFNMRPTHLLSILIILVVSCNYYKPVTQNTSTNNEKKNVITAGAPDKYFIIRKGDQRWTLGDISVDNSAMTLNGKLSAVDESHLLYIKAKDKKYRYKKQKQQTVLQEVHLYLKETASVDTTKSFSLPLDQIEKIEVIQHDKQKTTTSYVLGGIGITLGVLTVAGIIVALTKSSCPFVSTYDGQQYIVQGELFGGAVNRNLQRADYLPLKIQPVNGAFQLRISNELQERQFTDIAKLLVIEHSDDAQIGVDNSGNVYRLSHPLPPFSALLNDRVDVLQTVTKTDGINCRFNDTTSTSATNDVILSFPNAGDSKSAKLVLQLKNSYWFDYLYGKFISNFGSRYESWQKKQNRQPVAAMKKWISDQQIPLTVSVKTPDGWKEISKLNTIGPLTNREVILPLTVEPPANHPIQVKISTGFMFWELDYAAIDFTAQQTTHITELQPSAAIDEKGNDVLTLLSQNDGKYLVQLETGNYTTITYKFDRPLDRGKSYSVVLVTSGYYEPVRQFTGRPNIAFLKAFKVPGAMAAYSRSEYEAITNTQSVIATNPK